MHRHASAYVTLQSAFLSEKHALYGYVLCDFLPWTVTPDNGVKMQRRLGGSQSRVQPLQSGSIPGLAALASAAPSTAVKTTHVSS